MIDLLRVNTDGTVDIHDRICGYGGSLPLDAFERPTGFAGAGRLLLVRCPNCRTQSLVSADMLRYSAIVPAIIEAQDGGPIRAAVQVLPWYGVEGAGGPPTTAATEGEAP